MTIQERARALFCGCSCGGIEVGMEVMHEPGCGYPEAEEIAAAMLAVHNAALESAAKYCEESTRFGGSKFAKGIRQMKEKHP